MTAGVWRRLLGGLTLPLVVLPVVGLLFDADVRLLLAYGLIALPLVGLAGAIAVGGGPWKVIWAAMVSLIAVSAAVLADSFEAWLALVVVFVLEFVYWFGAFPLRDRGSE